MENRALSSGAVERAVVGPRGMITMPPSFGFGVDGGGGGGLGVDVDVRVWVGVGVEMREEAVERVMSRARREKRERSVDFIVERIERDAGRVAVG
jgi:hypothetical protein